MSDGINREASIITSNKRSTANRTTRSFAKLSRVRSAKIRRMLLIASAIWPIRFARVGRTLKHFDDIVRNSFCEPDWKGSSHRSLRLQSRGILNNVLNVDQVEKRERGIWLDLDKYVDVAVRTIVAPDTGAKNGKLGNTLRPYGVSVLQYCCNDLFARHWPGRILGSASIYQLLRRLAMPQPRIELVDQLLCGVRDHGARREDRLGAGRI